MKLSLGFSPCPNDTFIFDALVHQRIDTEGLEFEVILADVEELNQRAFQADLVNIRLLIFYLVLPTQKPVIRKKCFFPISKGLFSREA